MRSQLILSLPLVLLSASGARAATIFVTRAEDSGAGSLRWAIEEANLRPGPDTIRFRTKGFMTIRPLSPLPALVGPATLDGNTGSPAHEVEIDGTAAGALSMGLTLEGQGCVVRRLVINRFTFGLTLFGVGNHRVEDSFIGTDSRGQSELGNFHGFWIDSLGNHVVDNVISGNAYGVTIAWGGSNVIERNTIGPDARGLNFATTDSVSQGTGVFVAVSSDNVIRDNLIAGSQWGALLHEASRTALLGNSFGTDRSGRVPVGDLDYGILILANSKSNVVGGPLPGEGNRFANRSRYAWGSRGAYVSDSVGNTFRGNQFYELGSASYWPIELVPPANQSQPAPTLEAATSDGASLEVRGTLSAEGESEYAIDFYSTWVSPVTASCESRTYLGSLDVRTDTTGVAEIAFTTESGTPPGALVSATATALATGDTSEYSACQDVFRR